MVRSVAFWTVFIIASAFVSTASAEEVGQEAQEFRTSVSVALQGSVSQDGFGPTVTLAIQRPIYVEYFGVTCFGLVSPAYGEAHCGVFMMPADWLYLSLSGGLETNEQIYRVSGSLMVNAGPFMAIAVLEYGGSGRWHHIRAAFRLGEHVQLGLMSQRFEGEGPFIQVGVGRVSIRASYLFDVERYVDERAEYDWRNNRFYTALISLNVRVSP